MKDDLADNNCTIGAVSYFSKERRILLGQNSRANQRKVFKKKKMKIYPLEEANGQLREA